MQGSLGRAIWWRREEERTNWAMEDGRESGAALGLHRWDTSSFVQMCSELLDASTQTAVTSFSPLGASL